jgi:hypothetical protein
VFFGSVVTREVRQVVQGAVPGNSAGVNRDRVIEAYNGEVVPLDNVLLPFPLNQPVPAPEGGAAAAAPSVAPAVFAPAPAQAVGAQALGASGPNY